MRRESRKQETELAPVTSNRNRYLARELNAVRREDPETTLSWRQRNGPESYRVFFETRRYTVNEKLFGN